MSAHSKTRREFVKAGLALGVVAATGITAHASNVKGNSGISDKPGRPDLGVVNQATAADLMAYDTAWADGLRSKGRLIL